MILAGVACALRVALVLLPLKRVVVLVDSLARMLPISLQPNARLLVLLADAAAWVSHGKGRCLSRSMLLYGLFKARRRPVALLIGACQSSRGFLSHAWIESEGEVFGEGGEGIRAFTPVLRFT